MFDKYNESARRVLFFARCEVSHRGGTELRTEHVLPASRSITATAAPDRLFASAFRL